MKMQKEFAQNVLFTGAGFTKNFGGLLAKEMWSKIFNNPKVQAHSRLKDLLLNDFDYESIYFHVISGDYRDQEKESINAAIFEAYQILDHICTEWTFRSDAPYPVNIYGVNKFIERFSGTRDEIGFFFTLNQDLFIERYFNTTRKMLIHPGVRKIPDAHKIISRLPLEKHDFATVPTSAQLATNVINPVSPITLNYVKLHGSFGWLSSKGINCYVIGREKELQIAEEPLLSWYSKLFAEVLSKPAMKLFVIGYAFKDHNVNDAISNSISNFGLKLYVLSPCAQSEFISKLKAADFGEAILKGLSGYFPYTLLDVFPSDQSESHAWKEIVECYFASRCIHYFPPLSSPSTRNSHFLMMLVRNDLL
jgi:hypothetical protein